MRVGGTGTLAAWQLPARALLQQPLMLLPYLHVPGCGRKDRVDCLQVVELLHGSARVRPGIVKHGQLAVCSTQDSEDAVHCCLCLAWSGGLRMVRSAALAAFLATPAAAAASLGPLLQWLGGHLFVCQQALFFNQQLAYLCVRARHADRSAGCQ